MTRIFNYEYQMVARNCIINAKFEFEDGMKWFMKQVVEGMNLKNENEFTMTLKCNIKMTNKKTDVTSCSPKENK